MVRDMMHLVALAAILTAALFTAGCGDMGSSPTTPVSSNGLIDSGAADMVEEEIPTLAVIRVTETLNGESVETWYVKIVSGIPIQGDPEEDGLVVLMQYDNSADVERPLNEFLIIKAGSHQTNRFGFETASGVAFRTASIAPHAERVNVNLDNPVPIRNSSKLLSKDYKFLYNLYNIDPDNETATATTQ